MLTPPTSRSMVCSRWQLVISSKSTQNNYTLKSFRFFRSFHVLSIFSLRTKSQLVSYMLKTYRDMQNYIFNAASNAKRVQESGWWERVSEWLMLQNLLFSQTEWISTAKGPIVSAHTEGKAGTHLRTRKNVKVKNWLGKIIIGKNMYEGQLPSHTQSGQLLVLIWCLLKWANFLAWRYKRWYELGESS